MKDRIFFNGLQYSSNGAGISKYIEKLSEQYLNTYYNIDILMRKDKKFNTKNVLIYKGKINNSTQRIFAEQITINNELNKYNLIHYPDYAMPIFTDKPCVVTIHDMNRYAMPEMWTNMQRQTFKHFMNVTIKKSKKIICVSQFTANEVVKHYPNINDNKIEVVLEGFEVEIKNSINKDYNVVAKKYKITKKYMLYVGTISPHKNIKRMIEAFYKIKKQGYDYQLVIAGKKGWLYNEIFELVKSKHLEKEVIFTDYVSNEDLELLYQNCLFSVFISLYEGFGFPPLEAMARNKAVLVSNVASIPEVVGEAGLYCNPLDVKEIAKKMITLIDNENLREDLIYKGKERLKIFKWEKTAKETYKIYEKILNKRRIV